MIRLLTLLSLSGCMYSNVSGDPVGQPKPGVGFVCTVTARCYDSPSYTSVYDVDVCRAVAAENKPADDAIEQCLVDTYDPGSCLTPLCYATCSAAESPCTY